jgi:ribosomal protein L16 Arg81 hydroxylase
MRDTNERFGLAELLFPYKIDEFLSRFWERECLLRRSDEQRSTLLSFETIEHILSTVRLPADALRIVCDGTHDQIHAKGGLVDPDQARTAWHAGKTLVFNALHRFWEPLGHVCHQLEMSLHQQVQTNVYMTPPGAKGFRPHVDTHDVFVVQAGGKKRWRVYGNPVPLPYRDETHQHRDSSDELGKPIIDTVLECGDVLYIPRGWVHGGCPTDC